MSPAIVTYRQPMRRFKIGMLDSNSPLKKPEGQGNSMAGALGLELGLSCNGWDWSTGMGCGLVEGISGSRGYRRCWVA